MSEPNGNGNGHGNMNTLAGYAGKDPLATSHGDALLDQNFQSLKSKEVRDSTSPTHELRFHSMTLSQPNTTGWDVQTSSEVSPDGRAYRTETLAKTDGVEKLNGGGLAEFKGRNEQRSSASHQGDDKNFVKQASDSSKTQLQETVVFGDETSGRTEMKMSSTSTSSSSKVVSSSSTVEYGDEPRYLLDSQEKKLQQPQQSQHQRDWEQDQRRQEQRIQEQMQRQEQQIRQEQLQRQEEFQRHEQIQRQEQQQRQEERFSESREQSNSTRNVQTQQHYEENKRYVDMDKASPEYQRHVQHLMEQPGEIISNTVEYPKPNVKMITTVKRLPDGTIVKNKRYETEQLTPSQTTHKQTNNQTQNQTHNQTRNQTQNQRRAQDVQDSQVRDVVDNVEQKHVTESQSFSSVKKSSRRYSTETTSETVEEYDDRGQPLSRVVQKAPAPTPSYAQPPPHSPRQSPASDFSTHGFPSVRPNKPTQEYASQRPAAAGEEVVVVRSEKSRQVKQHTSSQRTTETEVLGDDYQQPQRSPQKLREAPSPSWEQPTTPRRQQVDEDFSTHGFPSVRTTINTTTTRPDQPDGETLHTSKTVSRNQSANRKTNTERIIETQVEHPHAHSTPRSGSPRRSQPREDYGSQGVSSPRGPAGKPSTTGGSTTTKTTTTTTSEPLTRRQLQKEREVDAAHRAFAASLRSSSPADSTTSVGSHHQTPRSSVSSNRTFRREMREGSHDSQAPSESSRISSTTVTRHTGGTTSSSTTKTKTTRPVKSPSEPRSPTTKTGGNVITTTTTTTSSTTKTSPSPAPPSPTSAPASSAPPDNKLSQYTYTTTKPGDIFSLPPTTPPTINNEPTLTSTTTKTTTTTTSNNPKKSANETATATATDTDTDSQPIRKVKLSANEAMVVEEAPCVRRQYYQLGNEGENPETNESSGTPAGKKPHPMRRLHDEPEHQPQLRRSSKSPSVEPRPVQRETTFEGRRISQPDDQLSIDELILIEEMSGAPDLPTRPEKPSARAQSPQKPSTRAQSPGKPSARAQSPEKGPGLPQPRATPRQSPEKEQPTFKQPGEVTTPSQIEKQLPQSPGKTPGWTQPQVSPRQSPEKQLPQVQSPEKAPGVGQPSVSPRQTPEKQILLPTRVSPRESPEKQLPQEIPVKSRQSPEKELPSQQKREEEMFRSTITTTQKRTTNNLNEEFITNERDNQNQPNYEKKPQATAGKDEPMKTKPQETIESPDGGFISKATEVETQPEEKEAPTYRKKGLTRRETFEDRCRQILGMEEDGDTQGSYTQRPNDDQETENVTHTTIETIQVKIEDCPDDDDDDTPRRVTETYVVRTQPTIKVEEELLVDVTEPEGVEILTTPSKKVPKEGDGPKYPKEQEIPRIPKEEQEIPRNPNKEQEIPRTPKKEQTPSYVNEGETPRHPKDLDKPMYPKEQNSPRYPTDPENVGYPKESPRNPKEDAEPININEKATIVINKQGFKSPTWSPSPKSRAPEKSPSPTASPSLSPAFGRKTPTKLESSFVTEKIIDCQEKTMVEKIRQRPRTPSPTTPKKGTKPTEKLPEKETETEPEPEKDSEPETKTKATGVSVTKTETERRNSRTTKTKQPLTSKEPQSKLPAAKSPRKDSLTGRKRDSLVEETRTTTTATTVRQVRKPNDTNGSPSIKDRLRSSPRKQKTSPQQTRTPTPAQSRNPEDDVDGDSTSPDASPSRVSNERRRSSNISVHTEIIIDHTAPKSPRTERRPQNATNSAPSPIRKLPVTERKESAPVPRMGGTKPHPEMSSLKPGGERTRPSKCCTTKTINLSEQRINTATDIEGVIIDIQQAKSSREPSPDRIIPTPVPAEVETGKPRYPDVVQEPDDEPRRKPQVTNIPIFEEESQTYVGCQISELRSSNGLEVDILDNPTVEAPKSLDYPVNTPDTDESLLSVHEKVSRFTHSAEKVKQPRASAPFSREFDTHAKIPENDECLLSINQKVDKFLRTAENVIRPSSLSPRPEIERPGLEEIDEELLRDDCTLSVSQKVHKFIDTAEKLAPSMPQKSPRLVANIERHISRQSEPERELDEESEPELDRDSDVEDGDQTSHQETEEEVSQTVTKKQTIREFKQQTKETKDTRRESKEEPEKGPKRVPQKEPQMRLKEEPAKVPKYQAKLPQKVSQWEPKKQPQKEPKVPQRDSLWEPKKQPLTKLKDEPDKLTKKELKVPQKEPQMKLKEEPETRKAPQKEIRRDTLEHSEEEPEFSPDEEFDDEPLPMTKTHTTAIELKRQKEILNRPSVFGQRNPERKPSSTPSPNKLNGNRGRPSPSTSLITEEKRSYKNQVTNVNKPGSRKKHSIGHFNCTLAVK
ncbi:hypothetical protein M5D96_013611 [Drosophila gunungcola]|uniref:Uncharacterized protein n=1 Tax=Drosophila gunungcola TaxID=103775 RepID=A0A9P9YB13_9MUSC|nr:hypothetical protein M5D96_013611 [Drosophila gunungcola]